jgi:dTDP-4-dehydrorhamnose reductase
MKIAVTGSKGRLGSALVEGFDYYPILADVTNVKELNDTVSSINPDVIIHCAAFTNVDACETQFDKAIKVNYWGTRNVRNSFKGRMIHISTDFVFQGRRGPYTENSNDGHPVQKYGWTKFGAERYMRMAQDQYPNDTIVRTTNIYGSKHKSDFIQNLFHYTPEPPDIPYIESMDIMCTPTNVNHLAEAIDFLVHTATVIPLIHLAGDVTLPRLAAAHEVQEMFRLNFHICGEKYRGSVPRGRHGGLSCEYAKSLGFPIYTFRQGLEALAEDFLLWT